MKWLKRTAPKCPHCGQRAGAITGIHWDDDSDDAPNSLAECEVRVLKARVLELERRAGIASREDRKE